MKRLVCIVLTLLSAGTCHALPLGNPTEASIYTDSFWSDVGVSFCSLRVGFYGDFVFNRHMQVERRDRHAPFRNIDRFEIYTNAGYLALNLCDRIDLFTVLGASTLYAQNKQIPLSSTSDTLIDLAFVSDFSWSFGSRITLLEWCNFGLGIEGQYFRVDPTLDFLLDQATGTFHYLEHYVNYREWQVGIGLSYNFALPCSPLAFVPYIGAIWSDAKLDTHGLELTLSGIPETIPNFQQEKLWGYAVGTTFLVGDEIGITVEGRFASEKAFYVNGQFRF